MKYKIKIAKRFPFFFVGYYTKWRQNEIWCNIIRKSLFHNIFKFYIPRFFSVSRRIYQLKQYLLAIIRKLISRAIDYDAILVGSRLRMLKADIECLKGNHDWQDWSATCSGNIAEMNLQGENKYSYRACRHCGIEMPDSRDYFVKGIKEKNAKSFEDKRFS